METHKDKRNLLESVAGISVLRQNYKLELICIFN